MKLRKKRYLCNQRKRRFKHKPLILTYTESYSKPIHDWMKEWMDFIKTVLTPKSDVLKPSTRELAGKFDVTIEFSNTVLSKD